MNGWTRIGLPFSASATDKFSGATSPGPLLCCAEELSDFVQLLVGRSRLASFFVLLKPKMQRTAPFCDYFRTAMIICFSVSLRKTFRAGSFL